MTFADSIFETVKNRNKIYCIEASAATHSVLPHIKTHIINILKKQCHRGDNSKFNLLCFSSDVAKWCVSLVPCTNEYVTEAEEWLRHIQPEGTCNFLGALVSALREQLACSLCFVVTKYPNQDIDEILDLFAFIGLKTECHIRMCFMNNAIPQEVNDAQKVYCEIAKETNGTFGFVRLDSKNNIQIMDSPNNFLHTPSLTIVYDHISSEDQENANLKKLALKRMEDKQQLLNSLSNTSSPKDITEHFPISQIQSLYYQPFDLWKRISASHPYLECMHAICDSNISNMAENKISKLASAIIIGREVLARRYTDGQYYLGYVKQQISTNLFNIVFGSYEWSKSQFLTTHYQRTKLLDLIDFNDALKRSILPGDRVLAPDPTSATNDSHLGRYITGTVLHGAAIRDTSRTKMQDTKSIDTEPSSTEYLVVEFTHPLNKTEKILSDKVIHIPEPFFQRLSLEGAMPRVVREKLYHIPNYPENSLPGYPTSGNKKTPTDFTFTNLNVMKSRTLQVDYLMPPYCLPLYPVVEILEKDELSNNILAKSDWTEGSTVKTSKFLKKEHTIVPETKYTVTELELKVQYQLETFKDLVKPISDEKHSFFRGTTRNLNNDKKLSKESSILKTNEAWLRSSLINSSEKKIRFQNNRSDKFSETHNKATFKPPNLNEAYFSIHEEYFDDIRKIKENKSRELFDMESFDESSMSRLAINHPERLENGTSFNSELHQINIKQKKQTNNSNVCNITDLGQQDKERESIEKIKLERHQRQVQRRLDTEMYKFCDEERAKDKKINFRCNKSAERIHKENLAIQREQEELEKVQSLKREVLMEMEKNVEIVKPVPHSYDEINEKRISNLKKRLDYRENARKQRDEEALRYVEKLEENKRNRANARWWEAQNCMLKEFPA